MTKYFKTSNLFNGLFFIAVLVLLFSPSAKAVMIRGLMKVGLFQPDIDKTVKITPAIPDVVFQSTDGRKVHLAELKGKVVFINFWATWCPPCIAEMPSINSLYEKLKNNRNIVFIIVDADHNFNKSVPFMKKNRFTMPLYQVQVASSVPPELVTNSIPATTIIDKDGRIVFHQNGSADYSNPKILEYLNRIAK